MSREVDPTSTNLSEEDKQYLAQRGLLPTSVMPADEQRSMLDPEATAVPLADRANTGDVNTANLSIDQLEEMLAAKRKEQEATKPADLFGSTSGPSADEDDDDEDEPLDAPYDQYTKAQLYAEVERRNADREDDEKIVVEAPGNKAEYVDALNEDDEA